MFWPKKTSYSHLDIPRNNNGQLQKRKLDYSIKDIQQVKGEEVTFNIAIVKQIFLYATFNIN